MAVIRWHHPSQVLRLQTSLTLTLPEPETMNPCCPLLYLLHGGTENATTWLRETAIEALSQQYGMVTVSIDGLNSAYVNMRHGGKYFTYLTEELPAFLRRHLSLSPSKRMIGGFSMGGQGALRAALRRPELYDACFALSGARDTVPLFRQWAAMENGPDLSGVEDALGPLEEMRESEDDLVTAARNAARRNFPLPALYLACAEDDYAASLSQAFHEMMLSIGLNHQYFQSPGIHDYRFAEKALRWALKDFLGRR